MAGPFVRLKSPDRWLLLRVAGYRCAGRQALDESKDRCERVEHLVEHACRAVTAPIQGTGRRRANEGRAGERQDRECWGLGRYKRHWRVSVVTMTDLAGTA